MLGDSGPSGVATGVLRDGRGQWGGGVLLWWRVLHRSWALHSAVSLLLAGPVAPGRAWRKIEEQSPMDVDPLQHHHCLQDNQERLSDLMGPYWGTYGISYRVLPPLLVCTV